MPFNDQLNTDFTPLFWINSFNRPAVISYVFANSKNTLVTKTERSAIFNRQFNRSIAYEGFVEKTLEAESVPLSDRVILRSMMIANNLYTVDSDNNMIPIQLLDNSYTEKIEDGFLSVSFRVSFGKLNTPNV